MNDTRQIGSAVAAHTYRLVDAKTREEIPLPARRKCWDGSEITVSRFKPSRFQGNEGYIYTDRGEPFVPSVCGTEIVVS